MVSHREIDKKNRIAEEITKKGENNSGKKEYFFEWIVERLSNRDCKKRRGLSTCQNKALSNFKKRI